MPVHDYGAGFKGPMLPRQGDGRGWQRQLGTGRRVPPKKDILERYFLKFSKGGQATLHEDDLGLVDVPEEGQAEKAEQAEE